MTATWLVILGFHANRIDSRYLELPSFGFKHLVPRDRIRKLHEVQLHLLTETHVEPLNIRKGSQAEVKVQDMVLLSRKNLL
jgi:hypothetical protein